MGFLSGISSFCSSVVSTVYSAVGTAWGKTKEVAAQAIGWMADKAEGFIGQIKETWSKVKPYLIAVSPYFKMAAAAVASSLPWLSSAILILDKAVQALLALENSPILKKLEVAINWAIKSAKKLKETFLTPEEIEEANERKATFDQAVQHMSGRDAHAVALAAMINDYVKIQSVIRLVFESAPPTDFDHYLRLRATQKLLANVEQVLSEAQDVDEISGDDLFMLEVAGKLIRKNPDISDAETIRLDEIVLERFDKKLIPFVFEEMIAAWEVDLKTNQEEWSVLNKTLAKETVLLRRLEVSKKLSELTAGESEVLESLLESVSIIKKAASTLEKKNREMQNYVYAAEGFLQVLEKSGEQLESEGREYLAEEGTKVGMIIIDCAQNGKEWEALTEDEQSLIIDFANIFEEDCQNRLKKMLEVEVGA